MRIVHLSTYDVTGGAAQAAYRLHRGLRESGQDSFMLVRDRRSDDLTVKAFVPPMGLASRLRRRIRREKINRSFAPYRSTRPLGYEQFSDDRTATGTALVRQLPACDLINLHWIAGFLDYHEFFSAAPNRIPIVWRLADMNAFTGGCHFDHGCGKHAASCGACPQLGSTDSRDLSFQVWQRKKSVFGRLNPNRLHIVTLNDWMAEIIKSSPLLNRFAVSVIPNGVDTATFAPMGKRSAREILEIPQDARVALFVADDISNRRKGLSLLAEALRGLTSVPDLLLLSTGRGAPALQTQICHRHLGYIDNDRRLALAYSAADVFVIPSLQDNQPNTVLEAMACGTPVVGFNVGGIPDMVRPEITGLLVPGSDVCGLRSAILEVLRCPEKQTSMAVNCRRVVMEEYRLEEQIRRYRQVYEAVLQKFADETQPASKTYAIIPSP